MRLIDYLKKEYKDSSMRTLRQWIQFGRISVNGKPAKTASDEVSSSCCVKVLDRQTLIKENLEVLYQDDDIVVVIKPAGLLSVGSPKENRKTALYTLKHHLNKKVWPVQRLDQMTSGIMVFALNNNSKESLKKQFMEHTIKRQYLALVEGRFLKPKAVKDIKLWIKPVSAHKMVITTEGDSKALLASAKVEVIRYAKNSTLTRWTLFTGKKHQIRLMAQSEGHPVIGDSKYGTKTAPRLMLHACLLGFSHPRSKKTMLFESDAPFLSKS